MITFVQAFAQSLKKEASLVDILHKALTTVEPPRSFAKIRASQLTSTPAFCPREVALLDITKKQQKNKVIGVAQNVTFDQGLSLQHFLINKWLKDVVVGDWVCQVCSNIRPLSLIPKEPCGTCGKKLWKYKEVEVESLTDGYAGSLDTIIRINPNSKLFMVEVKTISKDEYKGLKAPLWEHRARTSLYLHLIRQAEHIRKFVHDDMAKVLYISKAYGTKDEASGAYTPFKEYNVHYDSELIQSYLAKAQAVKLFRTTGEMPARICPTSFVDRVKQCSCVAECFSGTYPSGVSP